MNEKKPLGTTMEMFPRTLKMVLIYCIAGNFPVVQTFTIFMTTTTDKILQPQNSHTRTFEHTHWQLTHMET